MPEHKNTRIGSRMNEPPTALRCTFLHFISFYFILLHFTSFYFILPHFTALHCTAQKKKRTEQGSVTSLGTPRSKRIRGSRRIVLPLSGEWRIPCIARRKVYPRTRGPARGLLAGVAAGLPPCFRIRNVPHAQVKKVLFLTEDPALKVAWRGVRGLVRSRVVFLSGGGGGGGGEGNLSRSWTRHLGDILHCFWCVFVVVCNNRSKVT